MKKIILLCCMFIFSIFMSGCTTNKQSDLFTKKQECSKYIPQIKEEFKNWESEFTDGHQLQEVFYSPKYDTCFKAYTLVGGLTEKVMVYAIDDIFTGKNFWQKSTGDLSDIDAFNSKIEDLKK